MLMNVFKVSPQIKDIMGFHDMDLCDPRIRDSGTFKSISRSLFNILDNVIAKLGTLSLNQEVAGLQDLGKRHRILYNVYFLPGYFRGFCKGMFNYIQDTLDNESYVRMYFLRSTATFEEPSDEKGGAENLADEKVNASLMVLRCLNAWRRFINEVCIQVNTGYNRNAEEQEEEAGLK